MSKYMSTFSLIGVMGLALGTSGCLTKDDSSVTPVTTILEGTWTTECSGPNADGEYSIESDKYMGTSLTFTETMYGQDATCTTESMVINSSSTITLSESYILTSGETVHDLNLTDAVFTMTPKATYVVTFLNNNEFCGAADWEIGVSKSIIGCDFDGDNISEVETEMYEIVEVNETSLRYGGNATPIVANRPTTLNNIKIYIKQNETTNNPLANTTWYNESDNWNGGASGECIKDTQSITIKFINNVMTMDIVSCDKDDGTIANSSINYPFTIGSNYTGSLNEELSKIDFDVSSVNTEYPILESGFLVNGNQLTFVLTDFDAHGIPESRSNIIMSDFTLSKI